MDPSAWFSCSLLSVFLSVSEQGNLVHRNPFFNMLISFITAVDAHTRLHFPSVCIALLARHKTFWHIFMEMHDWLLNSVRALVFFWSRNTQQPHSAASPRRCWRSWTPQRSWSMRPEVRAAPRLSPWAPLRSPEALTLAGWTRSWPRWRRM